METLEEFVDRLSISEGCYSHPCRRAPYITLKKSGTNISGEMTIFSEFGMERRDFSLIVLPTHEFKISGK